MRKLLLQIRKPENNPYIRKIRIFLAVTGIFFISLNHLFSQGVSVSGEISGQVLNDVNFNGAADSQDPGLPGIGIVAYDQHNNVIAEAVTGVSGSYTMSGFTDGEIYRVEFSFPQEFYLAVASKDILNVTAPSCDLDLLLHKPLDFTHDNPFFAMPMFLQSDRPQDAGRNVIIRMKSDLSSWDQDFKTIRKSEVGSIWGIAFKKTTQQLFTSAFVKQYAYIGSHGHGAVYITETTADGWKTSLYVDLISEGIDLGSLSVTDPRDCNYGAQVGYIGIGAIELSDDEQFLYAVNLYRNTLVKIPTDPSRLNEIEEINIPDPTCNGGTMRAFALRNHNGKLYVGVTCNAEFSRNEIDNVIFIYEFDHNSEVYTKVFESNYPKGYWRNDLSHDVKVQHWLTDIVFDDDGNMIILLNDRVGHRYCQGTAGRLDVQNGDILMVWNDNGVWRLENNGQAGTLTGAGVGNGQGPGGGEFFGLDHWDTFPGLHPEVSTGSALVIPGSSEVIVPSYDPEIRAYSGGLRKYSTINGQKTGSFSVYTHKTFPEFGKASAFGGIEALYEPLPLEIGDYVWFDQNENGIQDPGEIGLYGIELSLYDENCNKTATTVTDQEGHYKFNNSNVDLNGDGVFDNLQILKNYYVVIDDSRFAGNSINIDGEEYFLTVYNKGIGKNKDKNNNKGKLAENVCPEFNGNPYIPVFTESSGHNNYTADFGFADSEIFNLKLEKMLVTQNTVSYSDDVVFAIRVSNEGTITAGNIEVTDIISPAYEMDVSKNPEWALSGNEAVFNYADELLPGQSIEVFITLTLQPNAKLHEFQNCAAITSASNNEGNLMNPGINADDCTLPEIFDLALQKKVIGPELLYRPGDTVSFEIIVHNQGMISAQTYEIVDYLNGDLLFDSAINPTWTYAESAEGPKALLFIDDEELLPLTNRSFVINLIVNPEVTGKEILNAAEISKASTANESNPKDYDSTPDRLRNNDAGGIPGTPTESAIHLSPKSPISDEDDHDVAVIYITTYDLALTKKAKRNNLSLGQTATFEIEIHNQGSISADKITIVDYIPEGFVLADPLWQYYLNDNAKAEVTLSRVNGLLPPFGLLPGASVKIDINLLLDHIPAGVNFLTNEAEIKSSYDIAGNNLGLYDVDSTPDDIQGNDARGRQNQLDGNGIDDEDDHDWATVFVRSSVIIDPCYCLNNATDENDGQFNVWLRIVSPSDQEWRLDSVVGFYDLVSPMPPAPPVHYPVGMEIDETVIDPDEGISEYRIEALYITDSPYFIRFVNILGDTLIMDETHGLCAYEIVEIDGEFGVCMGDLVEYTVLNPNSAANYEWSLPSGGGSIVGPVTGNSVLVQWDPNPGFHSVKVIDQTATNCIAPTTKAVRVGRSIGAFATDDYVTISVGQSCEVEVTPDMIITICYVDCMNPDLVLEISLYDPKGNKLPSNVITSEYIGVELTAVITDLCGGQSGYTIVKAVDYLAPVIDCEYVEVDCEVLCEYPGPQVTDNCDPDPIVVIVNENTIKEDCSTGFIKTIVRQYIAFDKYGNQSEPCTQEIKVRRIDKNLIEFPPNFLISETTALTCGTFALDDKGNPHPSVTGTPHYQGMDIFNLCEDNVCQVIAGYHDVSIIGNCCHKRILRRWIVAENCEQISNEHITIHFQIIEINDLIPPIPVPPANFTVTTDGWSCSALVQLPELEITDNCSETFKVDIIYPGGMVENSNGAKVRLYPGVNNIIYKVYDECNNLAEVHMKVTVIDKTPPVAICQEYTVVSLPKAGIATVPALSFDSGSYDDCQISLIEARRFYHDDFGPAVIFTCSDLDSGYIDVVLRVYDEAENWNECIVKVEVQYVYPPVITCPGPITVECDHYYDPQNLALFFGTATATDPCGVEVEEGQPVFDISECNVGTIIRHFTATGRGGMTDNCTTTIIFVNSYPFLESQITWPDPATVTGCNIDDVSPDVLGWPILNEGPCDLVAYDYQDQQITGLAGEACYIIFRKWTVIDWCQRNSNGFKKWHHEQLIHVLNDVKPTILPLEDKEVCTYDENCENGYIELQAEAYDDCTERDNLFWRFSVDLFSDGTIDDTKYHIGKKANASGIYPIGTHTIYWTVDDRCGNEFTRVQQFTIKNCTKPNAVCIDHLIVELGPTIIDGELTATAHAIAQWFDWGSSHTCPDAYPLYFSFSQDINDTLILLDCSWTRVKKNKITLYVTDQFGNFDFCTTYLEVQDNNYICDPFDRCVTYPQDTIIISECDPDITPGNGLADAMEVNDNCDCDDYEVTYSDETVSDDSNTCFEILRTWEVDFNCENLDTTLQYFQTIIIRNYQTPALVCVSTPITVNAGINCTAFVSIPVPIYDAGECNDGLTLVHNSAYAANPGLNASGFYPVGETIVEYTLSDICENTSVCSIVVIVQDNTPPVCIPNDITIALDINGEATITGLDVAAGSTDNCGISTITVTPDMFGCGDLGFNSVTITVTDIYNNFTICEAQVEVIDTITQLCNANDFTLILGPDGTGILDPSDIYAGAGGCGGTADVSLEVNPDSFDCNDLGENDVQLIVTDNVTGISDTCEATVTVVDTIAPVCAVNDFVTVYIGESGTGTFTLADIDDQSYDPCGEIVSTVYDEIQEYNCDDVGFTDIFAITLTDNSGNTTICETAIIVADTLAPVCVPNDITLALEADGTVNITGMDVAFGSYDNCEILTITVIPNTFGCENLGENAVTITITDVNDNTSTCNAVVTIIDTLTLLCNPQDFTLILDEFGEGTLDPEDVYAGSGGCGGAADVSLEVNPGSFDCDDIGENIVQLIVTDNNTGISDTCEAIVTVVDTIAPVCAVNDFVTVYIGESGTGTFTLADIDDQSYDPCGIIVSTVYDEIEEYDCSDVGTTDVFTITLTDNSGNITVCETLISIQDTISPLCVPDNITVALDSSGVAIITGFDVASGSTDNCEIETIAVVPNTFACDDLGENTVIVTITDVNGNSSTCEATVTIIDTLTVLCIAQDFTLILDEFGEGTLDPEDVYAGSGGCGGTSDVTLEVNPDSFDCNDIGENTVQLIVTDNVTGISDTCEAVVTVVDTIAPQCLLVDTFIVYLDNDGFGSYIFDDIDEGSFDPCGEIVDTVHITQVFTCQDLNEMISDTVILTDNSGNTSECYTVITVLDTISPICVAVDTIYIPLDENGVAVLIGLDVDDGSFDNCVFVNLDVNPDTLYCNDAAIPIEFTLTVADASGNTSTCTGILIVLDTLPPTIECPSDTVISCLDIPEESMFPIVFGEPLVFDNCSQGGDYVELVVSNIDECGDGVIARNFTITDPSGNSASCTQLIVVESEDYAFDESNITWPDDTLNIDDCVSPESISPESLNSFPVIDMDNTGCVIIEVTYVDDNNIQGSCPDTILRVWTVFDPCQFSQDPASGVFEFTQVLIITDTIAPVIIAPGDTSINYSQYCPEFVYLDLFGYVIDCSEFVTITNDSPYADDNNSADASGDYPLGEIDTLTITINAEDHCGNESVYAYDIIVVNDTLLCSKPSFFFEAEMIELHADTFFISKPACTYASFSNTDPYDSTMFFDCNPIINPDSISIYLFDMDGNLVDSCDTEFKIVLLLADLCEEDNLINLVGNIANEYNYGVEDVIVNIYGTDNLKLLTKPDGAFDYVPPLPNGHYRVKPEKTGDYVNGVNTLDVINIQKHILNIKDLGSPYRIIAADIDNNRRITASDILLLRKLILGEIDEFPNNDSWKFIDNNYHFINPENPLNEDYSQECGIENLSEKVRADFTGVKIGDVNNSAMANSLMALANRSAGAVTTFTDDIYIRKGDLVNIPLKNSAEENIAGLQFTFEFNPEYLQFKGTADGEISLVEQNIGLKRKDKGIITFSWNDTRSRRIEANAELFTLEFIANNSGMISDLIRISSIITPALVFDGFDNEKILELKVRSENHEGFVVHQNEPNPWSSSTNIRYDLPRNGTVNIKITNGFGVLLLEKSIEGTHGSNSLTIEKNMINYSGLLILEMEFEGKRQNKKMVRF